MKKNIINTALLALTFGIFSQGTLHAMEEDSLNYNWRVVLERFND